MTNDEINKAKEEIKNKIEKRDELIELKKEYDAIKNNPIVLRYLELRNHIDDKVYDDDTIIYSVIKKICVYSKDSNIYVYMGKYRYSDPYSRSDEKVLGDDERVDYYLYIDIQSENSISIKPELHEAFEAKYPVIKNINQLCSQNRFYRIQEIYFKDLFNNSQIDGKEFVKTIVRRMKNGSK